MLAAPKGCPPSREPAAPTSEATDGVASGASGPCCPAPSPSPQVLSQLEACGLVETIPHQCRRLPHQVSGVRSVGPALGAGAEPGWRSGHAQQTRRWSERQARRRSAWSSGAVLTCCALVCGGHRVCPTVRREGRDVSGRWLPILQVQGWPGERKRGRSGLWRGCGSGTWADGWWVTGSGAADFQATEATSSFHLRQMGGPGQLL